MREAGGERKPEAQADARWMLGGEKSGRRREEGAGGRERTGLAAEGEAWKLEEAAAGELDGGDSPTHGMGVMRRRMGGVDAVSAVACTAASG
jgi:hypothetical protein